MKNNFVATVRIRLEDFVGIAEYLHDLGITHTSKSKVISDGVRMLGQHLPEKYHCYSTEEAQRRFMAIGYQGGTERNNRLAGSLEKQLKEERDRIRYSGEEADMKQIKAFQQNWHEQKQTKIQISNIPEGLIYDEQSVETNSQPLKSSVTAQEGCEADVPGNKMNQKQAMLNATNAMITKENDE